MSGTLGGRDMRYWLLGTGMALSVIGFLGAMIEVLGSGFDFSELFNGSNPLVDAQLALPKIVFFSSAMVSGSIFIVGSRIISHLRRIYEQ
jgi:hypothetical protein